MDKKKRGDKAPAAESRDIAALQLKIDAYSGMLYKIAYLQLKNSQDAEDVVQETFYQYFKNNKAFESDEHEKAWLIKVTLNGCRKIWCSAWYRRTDSAVESELAAAGSMEKDGGIEKDALIKERNREIMTAVRKLPAKYREVIHLFYYQQMSIKEICFVTERKESTVTSQLTRGRDLLKKYLKEEYRYE